MNQIRKKSFLLLLIVISSFLMGNEVENNRKPSFFTSDSENNYILSKNISKSSNKSEDFKPRSSNVETFKYKSKKQKVVSEDFIRKVTKNPDNNQAKENEFRDVLNVKDIKTKISQTGKSKKEVFIQALIPIIDEIHTDISIEKGKLERIIRNGVKTNEDKNFLNELFVKYNVSNQNIDELRSKVIIVPKSLILAQASLESGWGSSGVALDANNLFGMKSWAKDQRSYKVGANTYYKKYNTIKDSVSDYMLTLSRHRAYKSLRTAIGDGNDSLQLVKHLNNYSELKSEYGRKVGVIIRANNLLEYDS
ncbi:glucosaminidase domain-containing protein [Fusobacterium sp. PH5-44]|uniref:glucosaminidase domain-containing protein n=1 Tax=unclassified Fusobacterium TaxID=2648384 RepID=UPI003D216CB6